MRIEDLRVVLDTDNTRLMRTRPITPGELLELASQQPDTLIISKVDGEWPVEAVQAFMADQRHKNWTDFHPEAYCHRCGRPNICWWVDSPEWNLAIRTYEDGHHIGTVEGYPNSEIICPQCLVEAWEKATGAHVCWELRIDPLTDHRSKPLDALLEGQPK